MTLLSEIKSKINRFKEHQRLKSIYRQNELLCQEKEERIEEFYNNHPLSK